MSDNQWFVKLLFGVNKRRQSLLCNTLQREENRRRLLTDGCIMAFDGWVPEKKTARLTAYLDTADCDYIMADNSTILEKLDGLVARFEEISTLITDPAVDVYKRQRFTPRQNKELL